MRRIAYTQARFHAPPHTLDSTTPKGKYLLIRGTSGFCVFVMGISSATAMLVTSGSGASVISITSGLGVPVTTHQILSDQDFALSIHTIASLSVPCPSCACEVSGFGVAFLAHHDARTAMIKVAGAVHCNQLIGNAGIRGAWLACGVARKGVCT